MFKSFLSDTGRNLTSDDEFKPSFCLKATKSNEIAMKIIEKLSNINKKQKLHCSNLQNQLKLLTEQILDEAEKNKERLVLLKKLSELEEELNALKKENEVLKLGVNREFEIKIDVIKAEYEDKLLKYKEKMEEEENAIMELKTNAKMEEAEFQYELNKASAKYHELELKMKQLLEESANKLKEANNSNNNLRTELIKTKQDCHELISASEKTSLKKIHSLEDELLTVNNQLRIAREKLSEKDMGSCPKYKTAKYNYKENQSTGKYIDDGISSPKNNSTNIDESNAIVVSKTTAVNNSESSSNVLTKPSKFEFMISNKSYYSPLNIVSSSPNIESTLSNKQPQVLSLRPSSLNINKEEPSSKPGLFSTFSTSNTSHSSEEPHQLHMKNYFGGLNNQDLNKMRYGEDGNRFETPVKEPRKNFIFQKRVPEKVALPRLKKLSLEISNEVPQKQKKRKLYTLNSEL